MDSVDEITDNSEAEPTIFRYEKFQNPDLENSPILSNVNEKNTGSLKRKIDSSEEIVPKKLLRQNDTDVVIDLFLNGSKYDVRSDSFSTGDTSIRKENDRTDSINESHSNLLPFVRENINEVNSSNFDDKSMTSENAEGYQDEILNITEQKELLTINRKVFEISKEKNQINSNFQALAVSEENLQHNNAFCEITLTDDANTVTKIPSSIFFENSGVCTNDAKILVNGPETNYSSLSLVKNMDGALIPRTYNTITASTEKWNECNSIIGTETEEEKLLGMKRDINGQFLAAESKISNQDKMTENDKQILNSSKHVMMATDNSFDENSVSHRGSLTHNKSHNNDGTADFGNSDNSLIISEQELPEVIKLQNAPKKQIKTDEGVSVLAKNEDQPKNPSTTNYMVINVQSLAGRKDISNQSKIIEIEEQSLKSSKHDMALMTIEDCSSLKTPTICREHKISQQELQSCDPILYCDDADISLIISEQELPEVSKLQNASEQTIEAYEEVSIPAKKEEQTKNNSSCATDFVDISLERLAGGNEISDQNKLIGTEEKNLKSSKHETMTISDDSSFENPTISHSDTVVQQDSQNSFISEQQLKEVFKEQTSAEQTGKNEISDLSKNKEQLKDKQSRGTKRKIAALKDLDQENSTILDLIKEYVKNTKTKEFTFQDIADFVRKCAPNLHYFKVVHSVRVFLEGSLKTGALKIFGKKYTFQCGMLDASTTSVKSVKKAKAHPVHGMNLIW